MKSSLKSIFHTVMEETIGRVKHVPQERVQSNTAEDVVAVAAPRTRQETGHVIQLVPQDRISDRNGEQIANIPIPQIREELVEMTHAARTNVRMHRRSDEMKTTTQERRWSHAEIDYMVKTDKKHRDKEMANRVKVGGKNGLECHGDPMGNNATVEKVKFKWKV